jgi:hypothetical protein
MKTQNKSGRPKKIAGLKKSYRVNVKMATDEYYSLKAKAHDAEITISECMRQCIKYSSIQQSPSLEMLDHIRKLSGMANNLNQIARRANAQGYTNARREYFYLAEKIDNLLNLIQNDS